MSVGPVIEACRREGRAALIGYLPVGFPSVAGSIEAMEAIKVLLGLGDTLVGRLLIYDALEEDFTSVRVERDPDCPACGDPDRPPKIVEYDQQCLHVGNVQRTALAN